MTEAQRQRLAAIEAEVRAGGGTVSHDLTGDGYVIVTETYPDETPAHSAIYPDGSVVY